MCKIITINYKKPNSNVKKHINRAVSLVTESERSGYGVTILTSTDIYYYKTKNVYQSFLDEGYPICESEHESTIPESFDFKSVLSFVVHGRTSTNEVSINATHPIMHDGYYMNHNGVINSTDTFSDLRTNNDTEVLLRSFLAAQDITDFNSRITGYAAFFVASVENGLTRLQFYKDQTASMHFASDSRLDVFSTKKDHAASFTKASVSSVLDNIYISDVLESYDYIEHLGLSYESRQAAWAEKSLGRSINTAPSMFNDGGYSDHDMYWLNKGLGYDHDTILEDSDLRKVGNE